MRYWKRVWISAAATGRRTRNLHHPVPIRQNNYFEDNSDASGRRGLQVTAIHRHADAFEQGAHARQKKMWKVNSDPNCAGQS